MRIIHLVRAKSWGGGERYAFDLARKSAEKGDDVTVITRGIPAVDTRFKGIGVELQRMPLGGVMDIVSPWRLARLVESYSEERVVVHVHNFKDAEIAARAKRLLSLEKRIHLVCTRHLVRRGKCGWRWKKIYGGIDRLVFVSGLSKKEFLRGGPEVDLSKIVVVHNSVVLPEMYQVPLKLKDHLGPLKILFVGRLDPEKGVDVLIRAFARIPKGTCRLRIVGKGAPKYEEALRGLAEESGVADEIEWAGFREDVFREIREADICVLPSVERESFGLSVIEFMSQARPVVTTSNGAQREIIIHCHDGLLVEPGDVEALAEAIKRLCEDFPMRQQLARNAYATFALRFRYDRFFQRINAVYRSQD